MRMAESRETAKSVDRGDSLPGAVASNCMLTTQKREKRNQIYWIAGELGSGFITGFFDFSDSEYGRTDSSKSDHGESCCDRW